MLDKIFLDYIKTPYIHHFASNDPAVDILVRNDTWTGSINQPYTLNIQLDYRGKRENYSLMDKFEYTLKSGFHKVNGFCGGYLANFLGIERCRGSGSEVGDKENKHGYYLDSKDFEMKSFDSALSDFQCGYDMPKEFIAFEYTAYQTQIFNTSTLCAYIENGDRTVNSLWKHYETDWLSHVGDEMVCRCPDVEDDKTLQTVIKTWSNVANIEFGFNSDHPKVLFSYGSSEDQDEPTTVYDDRISWKNHKTKSAMLSIAFSNDACEGDWSAKDYSELQHGLAHIMSLDHPGDSLLFEVSKKYHAIEDDSALSMRYNPFSSCATVLAGGQDSHNLQSCKFQGEELSPITPMPLDIKAMQHIYTKKCFNEQRIYKFDDYGSVDILGFAIPEKSIFALWGGCRQDNVLDLSEVSADNAQIDLNPGLGHFNVVDDYLFLIAYESDIATVISPDADMIEIITAENGTHTLFINTVSSDIKVRISDCVLVVGVL